jgi:hypothetical protein
MGNDTEQKIECRAEMGRAAETEEASVKSLEQGYGIEHTVVWEVE